MRKLWGVLLACFAITGFAQTAALVNINTANQQQLESVQGIGPKKAQAIIEHRQKHGQFKNVDELDQVQGFGKKSVEQLRAQVTVEGVLGNINDAPVDINTADQQQLESVQGIGPKKAQAIIEHRQKHDRFNSVDELDQVQGFGKKSVEQLRAQVTVEDAPGVPPVPSAIHGCYSC